MAEMKFKLNIKFKSTNPNNLTLDLTPKTHYSNSNFHIPNSKSFAVKLSVIIEKPMFIVDDATPHVAVHELFQGPHIVVPVVDVVREKVCLRIKN